MNSRITVSTNYDTCNATETNIRAENCIDNTQSISAVEDKKGKYWVAAVVSTKIKLFFIDSGADLSCCNEDLAQYGERKKLRKPIDVKSFDESSK